MMKRKNKILYFLGPTILGGATISFKNFVAQMVHDYEIVIAISRADLNIDFVNFLNGLNISIEYFNAEPSIYPLIRENKKIYDFLIYPYKILKKIVNIIDSKKEIKLIIDRVRPDIIHTNIGVLYQVIPVAKKLNIPHILHIREYQTKDFGWKTFPSKEYYQSELCKSHVITITQDLFNYFELTDHKNACVMYNGILSKNSVTFRSKKDKYFLCASRISEEKGIDSAINAFDKVAEQLPSHELWIAGGHATPEYYEKIKKLIDSKNCSGRIKLLGHRNDVVDLMKNATALIVASRFEGLGRMTVEAIFSGCLVVGRNSGGTKEVIELTEGGFLFHSDEQFTYLLNHIATLSDEDYSRIIKVAQKNAMKYFSNEVYCENLIKKYNNLINTK